MSQTIERRFEEVNWLDDNGPAALTLREYLQPVEGADAVIFPPTFAPEQEVRGAKSDYQIDNFEGSFEARIAYQHPGEEKLETHFRHDRAINVCVIDTVGAEANRIEPLFKREEYKHLVPQVVVVAGDEQINLLDAGHRAGDALVRFSSLAEQIWSGFSDLLNRNDADRLARLAPTSLVFGVWDSRGTQTKVPRIFRSVVRAFDVRQLRRSAQFIPAKDFTSPGQDLADVAAMFEGKKGDENPLSREGFLHASAVKTPGGIIVYGDIRREVTINLVALRSLRVCKKQERKKTEEATPTASPESAVSPAPTGSASPSGAETTPAPTAPPPQQELYVTDEQATTKLRKYLFGLALVAATAKNPERFNLREGCLLRIHRERKATWTAVPFDGPDMTITDLTDTLAKDYADAAARDFGVTQPQQPATFDKDLASRWLKLEKKKQDELRRLRPMTRQFDQPAEDSETDVPAPQAQAVTPARPRRSRRGKGQGEASKGDD